MEQDAEDCNSESRAWKTDKIRLRKPSEQASTALTRPPITQCNESSATSKINEELLDKRDPLKDEQAVILMEDYSFPKIDVIPSDGDHNTCEPTVESRSNACKKGK